MCLSNLCHFCGVELSIYLIFVFGDISRLGECLIDDSDLMMMMMMMMIV